MEIILLEGKPNIGKTLTFNIVYQLLLQNGYVQMPRCFKDLGNEEFYDILNNSETGKTIVFFTKSYNGEDPSPLIESLSKFDEHGIHIVICPCANGEEGNRFKETIEKYVIHVVDKIVTSNSAQQRIVNNWDANKILTRISRK